MAYVKGTMVKFRNGDEILTGWIESNLPVYDDQENVIGYVVSCPEFQGIVHADNIINEEDN
jgi:hypothetical protein